MFRTLAHLKASGKIENDSQPRIKDVLEELQIGTRVILRLMISF